MKISFFIGIILYFLLVPLAMGSLFAGRTAYIKREDIPLQYVLGYLGFLAVFTVYCIPMSLTRQPLHLLTHTTWFLSVAVILLAVCLNAVRYRKENPGSSFKEFFLLRNYRQWLRHALQTIRRNLWILVPMAIIAYQIWRVVFHMTYLYSDDDTYIPMINDMIYNDANLSHDPITGSELAAGTLADQRYTLSSWQQWEAFLCSTCGMHPLIFIKTVFPIFLIPFHYLIVWIFSRQFLDDVRKRTALVTFYCLLMEWGCANLNTNFSYYLLSWSWYGKAFLQFSVMPVILLFFFLISKEHSGWKEAVLLLALTGAGLGASSMGVILLLVELMVLLIIRTVHAGTVRELWLLVPALSPIILVSLLKLANYG